MTDEELTPSSPTVGTAEPDMREMPEPLVAEAIESVSTQPEFGSAEPTSPAESVALEPLVAEAIENVSAQPEFGSAEPTAPAESVAAEPAIAEAIEGVSAQPEFVAEATAPEPEPAMPEPIVPVPVVKAAKPEQAKSSNAPSDDAMLFEAAMAELEPSASAESSFKKLQKGEKIEATVILVEHDRVFVDLGTKSEGVVPLGELTDENVESAHGLVKVGDKINVIVLRPEGAEGNPIVSKKRAEFEAAWDKIVDAFQDQAVVTAQVIDRVKGGLVVDVGVRGFVPATHVGNGRLRNIDRFVGEKLSLKILEIDRERKKVVLSNRLAEDERRGEVRDKLFTEVAPGQILEGTVRRLTDYGAFVDLGGVDGLLHISEMSWMRINHPREVLKEGQKIKVMVLRLDQGAGKISLGLRQVLPDPWNLIRENYRVGQKIQCKIGRLVQSGAFVKLPEEAEAFLPISEISHRRIGKPSDVLAEGQEVELTIIDLRPDERRMVLSLRGGTAPDASYREPEFGGGHAEDDDRFRKGAASGKKKRRGGGGGGGGGAGRGGGGGGRRGEEDDFDAAIVGRVPTGGATIGERLGMLKGFQLREEYGDEPEELDTHGAEPAAEPVAETSEESTV